MNRRCGFFTTRSTLLNRRSRKPRDKSIKRLLCFHFPFIYLFIQNILSPVSVCFFIYLFFFFLNLFFNPIESNRIQDVREKVQFVLLSTALSAVGRAAHCSSALPPPVTLQRRPVATQRNATQPLFTAAVYIMQLHNFYI